MKLLKLLLETASPSRHEREVQRIVMRKIKQYGHAYHMDMYGNIVVRIGEQPKTLFTGHMDCVHNHTPVIIKQYEGVMNKQNIGQVISLAEECKQRALGGDDVVGVRMMLKMIKENVKALYIFTVEEEVGCNGASHAAKYCPDYIKHAVTFDRRDICSVITSMSIGRCCSDDYADALIKELGMGHRRDLGGSVTDTEKFRNKTLNHTNISAGYYREHSAQEWLSVPYVIALLERVSKIDWEGLPMVERPAPPAYNRGSYWGGGRKFKSVSEKMQDAVDEALDLEVAFDNVMEVIEKNSPAPYFSKSEFQEFMESLQFLYYYDMGSLREALTKQEKKQRKGKKKEG